MAGAGPLLVAVTVKVTTSPTAGVGLSTVLSSPTSASTPSFTVALAVSLLVFGSGSFAAVLVAMFVIVPGTVTCAVNVSCALAPFARLPRIHWPLLATYPPCDADALFSARPAGRRSVTTTPEAAFGPLFAAVIVKVTMSPTSTVSGLTLFVTAMSAWVITLVVASPVLLSRLGSVVPLDTLATFWIGFGVRYSCGTAKVVVMVRCSPGASVPSAHGKAVVQSPAFETKVSPDGGASITVAFCAVDGPMFCTVMV